VAQLVRGITFPTTAKGHEPGEGAVACLRTANVQADVEWDDLWYVPRDYVKHDEQYVQSGDVLISTANSYELVGKVARVKAPHQEASLGAFISLLRAEAGVCSTYFYYLMSSDSIQRAIREMASTTTNLSNVSGGKLKELQLLIAPSAEQTRIVEKLEELLSDLDAGMAELKAAQRKLVQYRQSLLKAAVEGSLTADWRAARTQTGEPQETGTELLQRILTERRARWEANQLARFAEQDKTPPKGWQTKYKEPVAPDTTDLPALPEGWVWASLDMLCEIQGGIQKQPSRVPVANKYPFLRVANVARGRLKLDDVHEIELFGDELARLSLCKGDLLIVEGNGSLSEIGRCALWDGSIANAVHQNHLIRARPVLAANEFIEAWLNSLRGIAKMTKLAATTSGLYTLSVGKISKIPVPLPPLDEQLAATSILSTTLGEQTLQSEEIDLALKQATAQRKNILKAAFAGQLVPQDPSDEPASVLLERIRTERSAEGKAITRKRGRQAKEST